jgi:hypothetical protein
MLNVLAANSASVGRIHRLIQERMLKQRRKVVADEWEV